MNGTFEKTEYTVLSYRKNRLVCEFILRDYFLKKTASVSNYHFHSAYEVHICVEGSMQITVEDQKLTLLPHDLCLIAPGCVHDVRLDEGASSMGFRFRFSHGGRESGEEYMLLEAAFGQMENSFILRNSSLLDKYILHASENLKSSGSTLITSSLLFLAIYDLASCIMGQERADENGEDAFLNIALSEEIETYINAHYNQPITLSEIAAHINLGVRQTERTIKSLFGMTYGELLSQKRLAAAKLLLRTTSASIGEIAAACGYVEESYFCRRFKTAFGISPGKYRAENSEKKGTH